MTFLFVDSIHDDNIEAPVRGSLNVSMDERYLVEHIKGSPVFMPSLIGESIGQLAAWAVMKKCRFSHRPVAGLVSSVRLLGEVRPGDAVDILAHIDKFEEDAVSYHGEARVNDELVFEIESALGPMLPMDEFIDRHEVIEQSQRIKQGRFKRDLSDDSRLNIQDVSFDTITYTQENRPVIAQKQVDGRAPYFGQHFPKKPVLPLTILLHCKLELAMNYVERFIGEAYRAVSVSKIKMSRFVVPGDALETRMTLKRQSQEQLLFLFRSEVNQQRVCVCEALFEKVERNT